MQRWRPISRLTRSRCRCAYLQTTDNVRSFCSTSTRLQNDSNASEKPKNTPNTRRQKAANAASEILSLHHSRNNENDTTSNIRYQDVERPTTDQPKELRRTAGAPVEVRRRPPTSANTSFSRPRAEVKEVRRTQTDPAAGMPGKGRPKFRPNMDIDADVDNAHLGYTRGVGGKRGPAKRRRKMTSQNMLSASAASESFEDDDEDVVAFNDDMEEEDGEDEDYEGDEDDDYVDDQWSMIHEEDIFDEAPDSDFVSENERRHYMHLLAIQRTAADTLASAEVTRKEAAKTGEEELISAADEHDKATDIVAQYAVDELNRTPDVVAPRHEPAEAEPMESWRGKIGGVPTGPGGMGNVVEDGLRYLANREDPEWIAPGKLGQRLIDGEFVKFDHKLERSEVLNVSGHLRPKAEPDPLGRKVGMPSPYSFKRLTKWQKGVLVKRLVEGRYEETKDQTVTNPVLRNVARVLKGNPTFRSSNEDKVMDVVKSLLPKEKSHRDQEQRK